MLNLLLRRMLPVCVVIALWPGAAFAQTISAGITITTNPPGMQVVVDGVTGAAPVTRDWLVGSTHRVAAVQPPAVDGVKLAFTRWSSGETTAQIDLTVTAAGTYTANFVTRYGLDVQITPPGSGTVTSSPAAADFFFDPGTSVSLTEIPAVGNLFGSWSGAATGAARTVIVVMDAPKSVAANFDLCAFQFSPASILLRPDDTRGEISVTAPAGCNWTAGADASWLSISPFNAGQGSGKLSFGASPNTGDQQRTGTLTIGGKAYNVTQAAANAPAFMAEGVVNAASYAGGGLAAGEVVAIFGLGLGPKDIALAETGASGELAKTAGDVRMLFDGNPAPMIYATENQIAGIVPYAVFGHAKTQVQVEYLGKTTPPIDIRIADSHVGLFSLDSSGRGQGIILNADGSPNGKDNPAPRGSMITLFATGAGPVPYTSEGRGPSEAKPLGRGVYVRMGNAELGATAAGVLPGLMPGLIVIQLTVPPEVSAGTQPIEVMIGGYTSQAGLTVEIKP